MGYDDNETERSFERRGRRQQPVKRPGDREPDRRRSGRQSYSEYPGYSEYGLHSEHAYRDRGRSGRSRTEPELTLMTDSFSHKDTGQGPRSSRGKGSGGSGVRKNSSSGRNGGSNGGRNGGSGSIRNGGSGGGRNGGSGNGGFGNGSRSSGGPQKPFRKNVRKKKFKVLIILLEVLILVGVLAFAGYSYVGSKLSGIHKLEWNPDVIKNTNISQEKKDQMKGYWTIAIFGVDSRNSSLGKGTNSDVIMLCNINMDTGEIKVVSVYRDTYLDINDKNSYNKINSAYLRGGPDQAVAALNKNLDLDIDDYVTFNWKAVAEIINILDGVDVDITKAEFKYINAFITETVKATGIASTQLKKPGMNHLDGVQAVAYGRLRLMDTDYARTERQRKIIQLTFDKAKKADWSTLNNIIQTVYKHVSTSVELSDVIRMGQGIGKLHLGDTTGFPQERLEKNMGSKGACVLPNTLVSNVAVLHQFLFGDENYESSDVVKTISKKITADGGKVYSKPTESTDSKQTKESTEKYGESSTESDGSKASGSHEETSKAYHEYETDAYGNVIIYPSRPRESTGAWWNSTEASEGAQWESQPRPGTNVLKPGAGTSPTLESGPGGAVKPGGSQNGGPSDLPGESTDTGVIIRPGSQPGNRPGGQSGYQPGGQSGNQPGGQSGNQPGGQSGNQSGNQPGGQSGNQPGGQSGNQPGGQSGYQPGGQSGYQPGGQSGYQPGGYGSPGYGY